jgi:putative nucleotidyltransferase with HDIG domain
VRQACDILAEAGEHDGAGRYQQAIEGYESAIAAAESEPDDRTLAAALRLLAVALHQRQERYAATTLCRRSLDVAERLGDALLRAQSLNTLAAFDLAEGAFEAARKTFNAALDSGGADARLRGRIEQNLGIMDNIQGNLAGALAHYQRALDAFRIGGDERGCAMAYISLGMISADQERWDDADASFTRSLELTSRLGDQYLRAHALLNRTEVDLARNQFDVAQHNAEEALRTFDTLGVTRYKAETYRVLGAVYRATGRMQLSESRLLMAIELAASVRAVLAEAESTRELALLYGETGRNQDALRLLNAAHRLFGKLDARVEMVDLASRADRLEGTFLAIVRDWGQSIESTDSYTHGHCERVATYALAVAHALGLDDGSHTAIRLGAYLHDVGKVRMPHEILNKPGKLTADEIRIMQRHPLDGVEMLASIEFPWDIKPIIRSHHEKYDGSGYPDGLAGEKIPLNAQIICIVDVFDALTTTRSYRPAMSWDVAMGVVRDSHAWWRPDVFDAFLRAMAPLRAAPLEPALSA